MLPQVSVVPENCGIQRRACWTVALPAPAEVAAAVLNDEYGALTVGSPTAVAAVLKLEMPVVVPAAVRTFPSPLFIPYCAAAHHLGLSCPDWRPRMLLAPARKWLSDPA